jgi:hypothetical protein
MHSGKLRKNSPRGDVGQTYLYQLRQPASQAGRQIQQMMQAFYGQTTCTQLGLCSGVQLFSEQHKVLKGSLCRVSPIKLEASASQVMQHCLQRSVDVLPRFQLLLLLPLLLLKLLAPAAHTVICNLM